MNKNKFVLKSAIVLTLLSVSTTTVGQVFADTNTSQASFTIEPNKQQKNVQNIQKRALKKTYTVIGSGVKNVKDLKEALDSQESDVQLTTNGNQVYQELGLPNVEDSQVHSSVRVSPAAKGSGVVVNIKPYKNDKNNITMITAQQYSMAATLSGIDDVVIDVSSDQPIGGQGALAGLYEAFAKDGMNLNTENIYPANQLIDSTSHAIQSHQNTDDYASKLSSSILGASADLSKQDNVDQTSAKMSLDKYLKQNEIDNKISPDDLNKIVDSLTIYANSPITKSHDFNKIVNDASKKLADSSGNMMGTSSSYANASITDKVKGFFQCLQKFVYGVIGKEYGPKTSGTNTDSNSNDIKIKQDDTPDSSSNGVSDNATNYSNGQSNSSELLKLYNQYQQGSKDNIFKVNGDQSTFTVKEKKQYFLLKDNGNKSTELNPVDGLKLSEFDSLGRTQIANGMVTKETISGTESRIPIPATEIFSGLYKDAKYDASTQNWHGGKTNNKKLDGVGYVINKGHLCAYSFFDNNKTPNKIKGVMDRHNLSYQLRYTNLPSFTHYEGIVRNAASKGHNVRIQVQPIYQGNELVPRLFHYQGFSVDDNGETVNFNVAIINAQPLDNGGYVKLNFNDGTLSVVNK